MSFEFSKAEKAKLAKQVKQPELRWGRYNLCLVIMVVNQLIEQGKRAVTSADACDILTQLGYDRCWNLSAAPADNGGFRRTVGDCLGNHPDALRLPCRRVKGGNVYELPATKIDDDYLIAKGLDPNLVRRNYAIK